MTYRGFDDYRRSRVSRAGSHYLDDNTLRFFDAYGGAQYGSSGSDLVVVVESVKDWNGERFYRPVAFRFESGKVATYRYSADALARSVARGTYVSAKALALAIGDGIATYMSDED